MEKKDWLKKASIESWPRLKWSCKPANWNQIICCHWRTL